MKKVVFMALLAFIAAGFIHSALWAADAPRMTKEELKARLGDSDVVVIDVRVPHAWGEGATKIKGAVREDPTGLKSWMDKYPKGKTYVFYCD
jgi:rhodanese-related sulfurtransferase